MENKVKKILLNIVKGKLQGFVVVRDSESNAYGFGKDDIDDARETYYSSAAKEIIEENATDLEKLTDQEAINKLVKMDKIVVSDQIVPLRIYLIDDPLQYRVVYADGETFEYNSDDFYDEDDFFDSLNVSLKDMRDVYHIATIEELEDVGLYKNVETLDKVLKDNHVSNFFVRNKKWLSILLIGGILTGIGVGLTRCSKTTKSAKTSTTEAPIELYTPKPTEEPVATTKPTKEIYIDLEEKTFPDYVEPETGVIYESVNGTDRCTDYYSVTLDSLADIRNPEASEIGNKIQGGFPLESRGTLIYFENAYPNLSLRDRAFIKYFSMMGNEIIKNAYLYDNIDGKKSVITYASLSAGEVVRLIRDNEPLTVYINGELTYIAFDTLSREAKEIVLNIAWTNNLPFIKAELGYGNQTIDQDYISDLIIEKNDSLYDVR